MCAAKSCCPAECMLSKLISMLLVAEKSLRWSQHGVVILTSRNKLLIHRSMSEHMMRRTANPSKRALDSKSNESRDTASCGTFDSGVSSRKASSLQGRASVHSVSMIETGRVRLQAKNLSSMYIDQNTRRISSLCSSGRVVSGSAFSLRSWTRRIARPTLTQPR
jgi:hypothetical protein